MMAKETDVVAALDAMMKACGLRGESGSEDLFWILLEAMQNVADDKWDTVEQSHKEGLCYDARFLLAEAIIEAVDNGEGPRYVHDAPN
jgi:hypothetical protein